MTSFFTSVKYEVTEYNCIKDIIIIDHHSENESDFNTPHVFNESDCSSASEIVTLLMDIMKNMKKNIL